MKKLAFLFFVFMPFLAYSQYIRLLELKIMDTNNNPIALKIVNLFNNNYELSWSIIDENGKFSFIIDTVLINSDSLYFTINDKVKDDNIETKIYVNNLDIFIDNRIGNYIITFSKFVSSN